MLCPKCAVENPLDATRCSSCGDSLSVAVLEVIRGELPEKIRFLKPRPYSVGRARHNDIAINEPSISKLHARLHYQDGHFFVEDAGSLADPPAVADPVTEPLDALDVVLAVAPLAARRADGPDHPVALLPLAERVGCDAGAPGKRAFDVMLACWDKGLMVRTTGDTVALSPPLIIEKTHIDRIVDVLGAAIKRCA